jgi:hypothetical protein
LAPLSGVPHARGPSRGDPGELATEYHRVPPRCLPAPLGWWKGHSFSNLSGIETVTAPEWRLTTPMNPFVLPWGHISARRGFPVFAELVRFVVSEILLRHRSRSIRSPVGGRGPFLPGAVILLTSHHLAWYFPHARVCRLGRAPCRESERPTPYDSSRYPPVYRSPM